MAVVPRDANGCVKWKHFFAMLALCVTIGTTTLAGAFRLHGGQPHSDAVNVREMDQVHATLARIETNIQKLIDRELDRRDRTVDGGS